MIKTKKIIIALWLFLSSFSVYADNEVNISPVVQVISYSDIYWKYPVMMWWWSASVINKEWIIISNDHVVDSWNWALASAFSVCVTKKTSEKPTCDYTASLIARDDDLDISILKIDEEDIYWNKVDYSKFKTIDIDFDYVPENQDETIAIWYPWIWADTISETKWIVSWVSNYNWYDYIKTDTLIAWWNSGWAFIRDWKLIWIPTFWIGYWDTMWYALLISEARYFIEENIWKTPQKNTITSLIDFNTYRKTIENINNSLELKDDVFDVKLLDDYQFSNYVKNNSFSIELKKQKDTWVSELYVALEKAPSIKNDKEKLYYFQTKWLYYKDWQKLVTKEINWIKYYYPVDKSDLSAWESSWGSTYFTIENWYLVYIYLYAPFYDEKRNKDVKIEVEKVLNNIKINKDNFSKIKRSFSTNVPEMSIKSLKNAVIDTWKYKFYLGNLYENFEIYLNELVEYNWKWKTAQEIYDVQLTDVDESQKSLLKFNWLDWYIYCWTSSYFSYYNYYNYYGWSNQTVDENWNIIELESCSINIFFPKNEELNRHNYLTLTLTTQKNNKVKNLSIAIEFLKRYLKTPGYEWETTVPNILSEQTKLNFTDIDNQTSYYKNFLKVLVRYGMIENSKKFNWDAPITWWEYLYMYSKYVYNFKVDWNCWKKDYKCMFTTYKYWDKTLDSIFKELWITDYSQYIDSQNYANFSTFFEYKLAWVDLWNYTWEDYYEFENLYSEEKYSKEKQKVDDFNNSIFGDKKIYLYNFINNYDNYFFSNKQAVYYPWIKKVVYLDKNANSWKVDFSLSWVQYKVELNKLNWELYKCSSKKSYSEYLKCFNDFDNKYKELNKKYYWDNEALDYIYEYYIIPLSRADAISNIFLKVDFALFDEKLAKKKNPNIDEKSSDINISDEELNDMVKDF